MSMIRSALAVVAILTEVGKIPAVIANNIAKEFCVTELRNIVTNNLLDELMQIPGVGEKRAAKVVEVLTGKIPEKLDTSRKVKTMKTRTKSMGFSLYSFGPKAILAEYEPFIHDLKEFTYEKADTPEATTALLDARKVADNFIKYAWRYRNDPIDVKKSSAKINRLTYSMAALIFGVDTESRMPQKQFVTVEHSVQEVLNFDWHAFGATQKEAEKRIETLQKIILRRIGSAGINMHTKSKVNGQWIPETILYKGFASSASHQKNEKIMMARKDLMELHEEAIYFGLKKEEFLKLKLNGAAIWKMRANLLRPLRMKLTTKDGREVFLHDIELVKDAKVMRHYDNARRVGVKTDDGEIYVDGPADEERTLWDGGAAYETEMNAEGQLTSILFKAMGQDGRSSNETAAKLLGVSVKHSDKLIMAGDGCWKGDKLGLTWDEYCERMKDLAVKYPGINNVWILREADEPEDTTKVRRLTRSLIQQWIYMSPEDIRAISRKARKSLKKMKTAKGALKMLAKAGIEDAERTTVEKLFNEAPWLVMCPNVQLYLKNVYEKRQAEAAGNKFITEGSYPYITEDLVAVYQIHRYGCDPNRKDLGVLKDGEMSVPGVANNAEVLAIRFPANYQTAKVMRNKSCKEAFASMGNIAVISIYDDILVRQDGDVDGDEMAIIINEIAIKYTKKMLEDFNPPVVLFEHGSKADLKPLGTEEYMNETMYDDLWKAKKFDGVGKYANLATLCGHLASIAHKHGDYASRDMYLLRMSLASTGAILAIDQVKGNAVSEELVDRLEEIGKLTRKECDYKMPYTQQFIKGIKANECNEESEALCDQLAGLIMRDTRAFKMNTGDMVWNKDEAKKVLTSIDGKLTYVREIVLKGSMINALADNWFNDSNSDEDKKTFAAIKNGQPVGAKEVATLLWRNACALEFRMEGENLVAKREEYRQTVKTILFSFADGEWKNGDYAYTENEKKASIVNSLVSPALNLVNNETGIDLDKRGSYAMFILKVFAEELLEAVRRNKVDISEFKMDMNSCDDLIIEDMTEEINEILFGDEVAEIVEPEVAWFHDDYDYDTVA